MADKITYNGYVFGFSWIPAFAGMTTGGTGITMWWLGLAALTFTTGAFFEKVSIILLLYLVAASLFLMRQSKSFFPYKNILQHPLFWGTTLFLLYGAATSFFSISSRLSLKIEAKFIGVLLCFVIFYHAPFLRQFPEKIKKIQWFFILLFGATLLALSEEVLTQGKGAFFLRHLFEKELPAYINLKPAAALMTLAVFPIAAFLIALHHRLVAGALIALVLWVCYAVYAQAAFLAIIAGFLVFLLCQLCPLGGIYGGIIGSVFLILGTPFIKFYLLSTSFWSAYLPESSSLYQRFLIWDFAIDRIFEKPLFGWGWGVSQFIPGASIKALDDMAFIPLHPHNNSIQIWLELGGIGALLLAILVALLFWQLHRQAQHRLYVATYTALLTAILIINSSSYSMWHMWWISWMGLICYLPRFLLTFDNPPKIIYT